MVCSKCKNDGVLSSAMGKEFYYCRTCKVEIDLDLRWDGKDFVEIDDLFAALDKDYQDASFDLYYGVGKDRQVLHTDDSDKS